MPARRSVPKNQLPKRLAYGINPVEAAIRRDFATVVFQDTSSNNDRVLRVVELAREKGLDIRPLQQQSWSNVLPDREHQGLAARHRKFPSLSLSDVAPPAEQRSTLLILDRIQDPHNLGAILRSAAAVGSDGVVLPKRGGCPVTPAVHKTSAGMSFEVPIVDDQNIARAIRILKDEGYWVVGLDAGGDAVVTEFEFPRRMALVVGNEAEGMRRLVRERCDFLARIPMATGVESLNVSVATAVVLYLHLSFHQS